LFIFKENIFLIDSYQKKIYRLSLRWTKI